MAAPFGDSSAFDEFERERTPILSKLAGAESQDDEDETAENDVEFVIGSPDEVSQSGENESGGAGGGGSRSGTPLIPLDSDNADSDCGGLSDDEDCERKAATNSLRHQLNHLKYEHARVKPCHRMLNPDKFFKDETGPALQVVFMNHTISRKYRADIEKFITSLVQREKFDYNSQKERVPPLQIRPSVVPLGDDPDTSDPAEQLRQFRASTAIGCDQFFEDFIIDCMGWPLVDYNPSLTHGWDIPPYMQVFDEAYPVEETTKPQKRQRPKASCFNCGGEHNLSDCKTPRDHRRIAESRRKFQSERSQPQQTLSSARYIEDPRFQKFKPGVISDDLRKALGLGPRQLPLHIYQMRMLGYPPGHLEAARIQTSGLSLFDGDGKELDMNEEVMEDGEYNPDKVPKVEYDFDKLIDYPGYNVEPPEGTVDDSERLRLMPMLPQHSKDVLKLYLTPQANKNVSKRQHSEIGNKRPKRNKRQKVTDGNTENLDMDMDSTDEGQLSQDSAAESSVASSRQTSREGSPTLDALEEAKRNLQLKLQLSSAEESDVEPLVLDSCGEEVQSQDSEAESSANEGGSFLPPLPPTPVRPPLPDNTPPGTPTTPRAGSQSPFIPNVPSPLVKGSPRPPQTPPPQGTPPVTPQGADRSQFIKTPSTGGSISMSLGTPVSEGSIAKDKGLPDSSKFALNMEDEIPFENLPNSTGTFKRMKKVLDFIRSRKSSS